MQRSSCFLIALSGCLLLAACNRASSAAESRATPLAKSEGASNSATIGKPAPDFELRDLEGHTVKLSQFRGKIIALPEREDFPKFFQEQQVVEFYAR